MTVSPYHPGDVVVWHSKRGDRIATIVEVYQSNSAGGTRRTVRLDVGNGVYIIRKMSVIVSVIGREGDR